jgi:serine/threonine-protein kinase
VAARGGDIETIFEANRTEVTDYHGIDLLPGGGLLVAVHDTGQTNAIEIWNGDERERLLELTDTWIADPHWVEAGYITFSRERTNAGVWALPFSPSAGKATGEAFLVTPDGSGATVSDDGTMIHVAAAGSSDVQLVWISAEGEVGRAIGQAQEGIFVPRLSPDGTSVLVTGRENGEWDIWIHDVARGSKTRLTFLDGIEGSANWSPDGKTVFFQHPVFGGSPSIYTVPSDGRGDPRELIQGGQFSLSADGEQLVFVRNHEEREDDLWTLPAAGGTEPEVFLSTSSDEDTPRFSPDGRFLAYESSESGRDEIYVEPFPSSEGKWQVSVNGGRSPVWSRDGTRLYYTWQEALFRVRVEADRGLTLSTPEKLFDGSEHRVSLRRGYDVGLATDPERFIVIQRLETEKDQAPVNGIFVIENWLGDP